jgi:hypothetical protein
MLVKLLTAGGISEPIIAGDRENFILLLIEEALLVCFGEEGNLIGKRKEVGKVTGKDPGSSEEERDSLFLFPSFINFISFTLRLLRRLKERKGRSSAVSFGNVLQFCENQKVRDPRTGTGSVDCPAASDW